MTTTYDNRETWDRLVLLLAARPRDGWEEVFEEVSRREVARLAPRSRQMESPAPGQSERGLEGETEAKEDSAYGRIIP